MKKFETPILELEKFEIMDVITTSVVCDDDECWTDGAIPCDNEI